MIISLFMVFVISTTAQIEFFFLSLIGISFEIVTVFLSLYFNIQAVGIIQADRAVKLEKIITEIGAAEHGNRNKSRKQ